MPIQTEPIVQIDSGRVQGELKQDIFVFKGIPYAEPPAGKLRWHPPRPCVPWKGVRRTVQYGPVCPQNLFPGVEVSASMEVVGPKQEDCLYLNIWTPGLDDKKRPVMLWIHGGAFIIGAASQGAYDGFGLCGKGDLVVVTINYRLGALGFIHLNNVTNGTIPATGNEGLLDQIAAIDWVRRNIGRFGGDPENITVFGESAGGMSIGCLLGMPAAKGKFKKAIVESGTANTVSTLENATQTASRYMDLLGIKVDEAEKLYSIDPDTLMTAQEKLSDMLRIEEGRITPFQPVIDGEWMPELPIDAIRKGASSDITVMAGSNLDEFALFNVMNPDMKNLDIKGIYKNLRDHLPGECIQDLISVYGGARTGRGESTSPAAILTAIQTDLMFGRATRQLLEAQSENNPATYGYLFDWKSPALDGALGACHTLEIGFVFGILEEAFHGSGPLADSLADKIQDAWISFAKTGDPGCRSLGKWVPYSIGRSTMRLGKNCRLEEDPLKEEREVWDKHGIVMTTPI